MSFETMLSHLLTAAFYTIHLRHVMPLFRHVVRHNLQGGPNIGEQNETLSYSRGNNGEARAWHQ